MYIFYAIYFVTKSQLYVLLLLLSFLSTQFIVYQYCNYTCFIYLMFNVARST